MLLLLRLFPGKVQFMTCKLKLDSLEADLLT